MANLTERQERFCIEYLIDFNATDAYLRAGYRCSRKTATQNASKLLVNVGIQERLSKVKKPALEKAEVTLERTLQELAYVAFSRVDHSLEFDEHGVKFRRSKELSENVIAAIESVSSSTTLRTGKDGETTETVKPTMKLHSKMAALNLLSKYFGIDSDWQQAQATLKRYGIALLEDESTLQDGG